MKNDQKSIGKLERERGETMSNKITPFGKYLFCVIATVLVAFLFFQFVQKPQIIKRVCDQQALERSVYGVPENKIPDTQQRDIVQTGLQKKYYENCVVLNGAKL